MPPNEDTTGVQKSGGALRAFFWFLIGLLLGVVLAAVGAYFALQNDILQQWLRNYFASASLQQFSQIATSTPPESPLKSFATASTTIAVPRAYTTPEYYAALNNVYFDYNNMIAVGNKIAPLLVKLNTQTTSGNYDGVVDLAVQIKLLISQELDIAAQFGQHLAALSVANQATKDATTKSLTQSLISSGNLFRDGLPPYLEALSGLFSGRTPAKEDIANVAALAKASTENVLDFKAKMQLLSDHFKAAAQSN